MPGTDLARIRTLVRGLIPYTWGRQTFSIKGRAVSVLGFVGQTASVAMAPVIRCNAIAAVDKT